MVFNQNGSTLTFWSKDNTNWAAFGFNFAENEDVAGIISNAINPFWVIVLTFPLVWFWGRLANHRLEPSTPAKMALGMLLLGVSFYVLFGAARTGEATVTSANSKVTRRLLRKAWMPRTSRGLARPTEGPSPPKGSLRCIASCTVRTSG